MKRFKLLRGALVAPFVLMGVLSVLDAQSVEPDLSPATQQGAPLTLEQFSDLIGKMTFSQARYEETHVSQILTEPLLSKGTLSFTPSRFEKHVLSPYEERYVIEGDFVMWEDIENGTTREVSLGNYPSLLLFVEGLRSVLAGDLHALTDWFAVDVSGRKSRWNLTLTSRENEIRQFVTAIRFTGKADEITEIEIQEASGDHSILTMTAERK